MSERNAISALCNRALYFVPRTARGEKVRPCDITLTVCAGSKVSAVWQYHKRLYVLTLSDLYCHGGNIKKVFPRNENFLRDKKENLIVWERQYGCRDTNAELNFFGRSTVMDVPSLWPLSCSGRPCCRDPAGRCSTTVTSWTRCTPQGTSTGAFMSAAVVT